MQSLNKGEPTEPMKTIFTLNPAKRVAAFPARDALSLATVGCRIFNCTDEAMNRERPN